MKFRRNLLVAAGVFLFLVAGSYFYFTRGLPVITKFEDYRPNLVTKVYSYDGQIIGEFYIEKRVVVPQSRIPAHLVKAFLAAEDAKFYEHEGISYISILRAFYKNLTAGKVVQGGSTITQQLAKSFLQTSERKLSRKIREAIMAYRIEKHLNKDEILNLYLNQIYFGSGAYGVQAAAETYFGKNVEDLDVAEAAMLAGLPKAPARYSPHANIELAKTRQEYIINRMLEENFITREEAEKAVKKELKLRPEDSGSLWVGPYFTEHVRRYLEEKYGSDLLYKGGLKVYTSLDVGMQKAANEAMDEGLREHDKRRGYRGPLMSLKSREAVDVFMEEADKELKGRPVETGKIYRGLVTKVDAKNIALSVDIGSRRGIVNRNDLSWARLYNPTNDPDGGRFERFERIFHAGDVIEVRVLDIPKDPLTPIPLALEQEPLAQGALIAMEPSTGLVRAMTGGSDFHKTPFNRAVQALRQPGSAFKPIIYAAAIDRNYTPATVVVDSPLVFEQASAEVQRSVQTGSGESAQEMEQWRPQNYDEQFMGPITVREALAKSRNVVTIKVLRDIGVDSAMEMAGRLGISSPLARDLSLALGSSAVTLIDLTKAFATFANLGERPEPVFVTKVTDKDGAVLEEAKPVTTPVLSPETSYIMTSLLQSVVDNGTGWRARALNRPVAGKTGTTNNLNDAWFIGYVPQLATGVWVGYDEEKKLGRSETGAMAALPIWVTFMEAATSGMTVESFRVPEGVEFAKIDPETGLLAGPTTKNPVFEVFKTGSAPTAESVEREKPISTDFFMMDTGFKPDGLPREDLRHPDDAIAGPPSQD